ncbi:nuclear transport factor 2 family protein [Aquiflexum gelatinilyticum]|uniref:Nuclear transport factor 2 family protein n=1 Tax=Aquiflexum gelatinilyticum TaxID=2961943 RepID=A0A9X2P444_9BACT|nr:nuclear transport factor 2 family protein [Aquiflexum gelatinilyticum]MCR9014872.1 nuclear transport factor 2 family protein [Aquiflexum gelatinilyticum]
MNQTQKQIASDFSLGNFAEVFEYMADNIRWEIIGEQTLEGKEMVKTHCQNIATYFQSVSTDFKIHQTIEENGKVAIIGLGEFIREGKTVSKISACDVYQFDSENKISSISSYCIEVFKTKNP